MKDGDHLHWVRMQVERQSFFVPGRDVPDVWMRIFWGGFFWWAVEKWWSIVWLCVNGSAVGFSEFLWGVAGSLAEVVAEGGRVPETAGEGCFCDGAGGGA